MDCFKETQTAGSTISIWQGGHPLDSPFPQLALQLVAIIAVTRALYFVLKPLRMPRVVSDIIGGVILGPSGLGRRQAFKELLFPTNGKGVLDTVSSFGLMFVIFLIGVKMDPGLIKRAGAKSLVIGLSGFIVPFALVSACIHMVRTELVPLTGEYGLLFSFSFAMSLSFTSFAVLVPIISDLNLLNSELGQIAMSASITNDILGWLLLTVYIVLDAGKDSAWMSVPAFCSVVALLATILFVVRPLAMRVIDKTLPGKPVDEGYIFVFLLIVLMIGFFSDLIGTNSFHGALVLGLAIPDGPPLGATIAEKTEGIVSGLFLPLFYAMIGAMTDVASVKGWHAIFWVVLSGLMGKMIGVLLPSLYFKIPLRDALSLSLFMNSKGLVEVVTYNYWWSNGIINNQTFTTLVILMATVTAMVTPIATILYEPSRRYMVYKRRTVQHHKVDSELRVLACIHDQSQVPPIINLLEASHPTVESQLSVYALHLVELVGRAAPLFIPHKLSPAEQHTHRVAESEHIANAFLLFEQRHCGAVVVNPFTTISPYASMHDEICRLAVEKRTALVLLPFHKGACTEGGNNGVRTANRNVLASAPCSVAVLVDAAGGSTVLPPLGEFRYEVVVFFFGGADDREALAIGAVMGAHPGVSITVVRFLPSRSIRDDQTERKLDGRALEDFRLANKRNQRVSYREALVRDMEEIVTVIRGMNESAFDIAMVGLRHFSNSVVSERLAEWADCPEIGVIGDMLASSDFATRFSVLVVKQQDEMGLHPHQRGKMAGDEGTGPPIHGGGKSGPLERLSSILRSSYFSRA